MPNFHYQPNLTDAFLQISRGASQTNSVVNKFGRNAEIDGGVTADIWDGGITVSSGGDSLLWVAPTAARVHSITGGANDTAAGTGARTIEVQGLDADWMLQTETVSMNGAGGVNTVGSYLRIFRMKVLTVGSGGANAAAIKATAATDSTVTARIEPGNNQTLMAIYTVPANHSCYVVNYYASMNRSQTSGAADILLHARDAGNSGPWQVKHIIGVSTGGASLFRHKFEPYAKFGEKTDIKLQAIATANNTDISAGFDLIQERLA